MYCGCSCYGFKKYQAANASISAMRIPTISLVDFIFGMSQKTEKIN
jgi:hypothetical protein